MHAAKNDLDAVWRAQAPDPTMLILAFDVAWLILVPARPAPGLLNGGESSGVGEPQPGPGTLEPPAGGGGLQVTIRHSTCQALLLGARVE